MSEISPVLPGAREVCGNGPCAAYTPTVEATCTLPGGWKSTLVKRVTFPSGKPYVVGCGVYCMQTDMSFIEDVVRRAAALIAESAVRPPFEQLRDKTGPFVFMDTCVFV